MEAVKLLPQSKILQEWWSEVKENFWQDDAKPEVLRLVKELMESTLKEELTVYTQAEWYKRTADRREYRNGYYKRSLITQFGTIDGIRTPRLRSKGFKTRVFRRYKRYQDIVEDLIQDIFLAGVSTRRIGDAVTKLLGTKVSHSTVSNITKRLDKKVREYKNKKILDEYQYLFLDGITLKIRYNNSYHNRKVLAAYGVSLFGQRELIGFMQSQGESLDAWEGFLNNLYRRGLKGENLKLIIVDGAKGLRSSLQIVYPLIPVQRCWAHKNRNVSNCLPKKYQQESVDELAKIYNAKSRYNALRAFKAWKRRWQSISPKAVNCLEKDLEELLHFYSFPESHWKKIRTTNVIERSFREVRRRTKVFSCFSNKESCDRIIYAIFVHLNGKWKEYPLREFTQFS
jgi:putative transposase